MRRSIAALCLALAFAAAAHHARAQAPSPAPITVVSAQGRRGLTVTTVNGGEYLSLDDVATAFGLTVRDDRVTGTSSVTAGARAAILTPDRTAVSVQGRLVSLAAPPLRQDGRLIVTPEFVTRVVAPLLDRRLEFRRAGRLFVVGDLRVPRVVVRGEFASAAAQVVLEISPAAETTITQSGSQLVVAIAADALDAAVPTVPAQGLLQQIRPGDTPSTLVLATGPRFASYRAAVQPVDAGTTRVVIDLLAAGAESLTAGGGAAPAAPTPPPAPAPPPVPPAGIDPGQPAQGTGLRTIVIDPGHGGDADGTAGTGGALEKTITLQVSRRLKALIESRLGLRVVLTRDDDRTLDQDQRAAVANNNRADLLISIHANAAVRPSVKGAEVYYLNVDRASLESRRAIQQPGETLPQLGGGSRAIELILWETAQVRHLEQSAAFATVVDAALRAKVAMSPSPVQQAPFRVLVGANMPAVLVEIGYLSNPDEEKALASAVHQDKVAQALLDAITTFRAQLEKPAQ